MEDRHDPMLSYAMTALAASKQARLRRAAGHLRPGRRRAQRHQRDALPGDRLARRPLRHRRRRWSGWSPRSSGRAASAPAATGPGSTVTAESVSGAVAFDPVLTELAAHALADRWGDVPVIPTMAGHDAGVLAAAGVPTAMMFVRNPTGVSHSPDELADDGRLPRRRRGPRRRARGAGRMRLQLEHALLATACLRRASSRSRTGDHRSRWRADLAGWRLRSQRQVTGRPAKPALPASPSPASPTATATRSTGRCGGTRSASEGRSGPGASRCTPSRPSLDPGLLLRARPRRPTPRCGPPGSPRSASSTTCTTSPTGRRTTTPTRWAGRCSRPPTRPASGSGCSTPATSPPGSADAPEGVQVRYSDGDAHAWAERVAAFDDPRVGAAIHSVRAVPARPAADRRRGARGQAAARAPLRAGRRERGLPRRDRADPDPAARRGRRARPADQRRARDPPDRRRHPPARARAAPTSASARPPSATSPTASVRRAGCTTPAPRSRWAPTATR